MINIINNSKILYIIIIILLILISVIFKYFDKIENFTTTIKTIYTTSPVTSTKTLYGFLSCQACDVCPADQYRNECGGISAGSCKACDYNCPAGQYSKCGVTDITNYEDVSNGLIAHYKFDTNLNDSSGNNNILTEDIVSDLRFPPIPLTSTEVTTKGFTSTISGQTYGNGTYLIETGEGYDSWNIFNSADFVNVLSNISPLHTNEVYNTPSGYYNYYSETSDPSDTDYLGTYLKITLPQKILLKKLAIRQRVDSPNAYGTWNRRMPRKFRIFGSNDNITWNQVYDHDENIELLTLDSNLDKFYDINYSNYNYYKHFLIIVNAVGNNTVLNFDHLRIYSHSYFDDNINNFAFGLNANLLLNTGLNLNNTSFTISCWLKSSHNGVGNYIFQQHQAVEENKSLHIGIRDSNQYTLAFYGNDLSTTIEYNNDLNESVHLVFIVKSNWNREIWRNGILVASDQNTTPLSVNDATFKIGGIYNGANYKGLINDLRIYNTPLTATEVSTLYNRYRSGGTSTGSCEVCEDNCPEGKYKSQCGVIEPTFENVSNGLIAHYKFDGDFSDSTGNNADAISSNTTFVSDNSIEGSSIQFNGSGTPSLVELPSTLNIGPRTRINGITLCGWFYTKSTITLGERILDFGKTNASNEGKPTLFIMNNSATSIKFESILSSDPNYVFTSYVKSELNVDTWYFYTWSISETGIWTIYINGVNQNVSITELPDIGIDTTAQYYLGKSHWVGDNYSKSLQDDFRVYNRPLTATEVSTLYNNPFITKTTIDSEYKYIKFLNDGNNQIIWDFNPHDTLESWSEYANSIGAKYNLISAFNDYIGVWSEGTTIGYIDFQPVPEGYSQVEITFGNLHIFGESGSVKLKIHNILSYEQYETKHTISDVSSYTWTGAVSTGDIIRIEEHSSIINANIKITLMKNKSYYNVNFPENTICDILVVGGGGAGGSAGGSGGGGDVIEYKNLNLSGTYDIFVGRGGLHSNNDGCLGGENGFNSKIMKNGNDYIIAAGGGAGGNYGYYKCNGANGTPARETPTVTFRDPITNEIITTSGGGAGGHGGDSADGYPGQSYRVNNYQLHQYFGKGGEGQNSDITGESIGYGGGGSAGQWNAPADWTAEQKKILSPSIDGGGSFNEPGIDGRGGGGSNGSNGGSGVVIIRYKRNIKPGPGNCTPCNQPCREGFYLQGCSGTNPGICRPCDDCPHGEYMTGHSGTNPCQCQQCSDCPTGEFRTWCNGTNPGICLQTDLYQNN
ncbi:hypothetical protein OAH43_00270 [bacterium]|nr:hypothetical protein [bacterium]